jgi:VWFA-related protein
VNSCSHFSFRCIGVQLTSYASSARFCLLGLFLILNNPASLVAQEPTQTSLSPGAIRVSVDRVNVGVTVTSLHGNFVKGLRREDFRVFDNGVEQPVTGFLSIEEPAQVVLLLECGPAALFLKKSEFQAADTLLGSISPVARVAIVSYSKSPDLVADFTTNKSEAQAALHGMNFMAGFSELNLASSITATLDWLAVLPGKKTIILLSSGVDTLCSSWPRPLVAASISQRTQRNWFVHTLKLHNSFDTSIASNSHRPRLMGECTHSTLRRSTPGIASNTVRLISPMPQPHISCPK